MIVCAQVCGCALVFKRETPNRNQDRKKLRKKERKGSMYAEEDRNKT